LLKNNLIQSFPKDPETFKEVFILGQIHSDMLFFLRSSITSTESISFLFETKCSIVQGSIGISVIIYL